MDRELILAAKENNVPEVCRLLTAGADVNAKDSKGETPLHWACRNGRVQIVKELLEHGADIEAKDNDGDTPLHWACCSGRLAVVNELLSRGANVEAKTTNGGYTPLHYAGVRDIIRALLSCGANILAVNNLGELPINTAVRLGRSAAAKHLLQQFYATMCGLPLHELLEDLTWIGDPWRSDAPPLRALLHKDTLRMDDVVEILEYLVGQNPALLRSRDQDGSLPLQVACCRRGASFTIVESLVNHYKASAKSRTPQGDLPLFLACEMPETSLDTIFILMKLHPELVCCLPVIAMTIEEAMLLEEIKQLKAKNAELKSEITAMRLRKA
jgi:ankyrin repeat protein